MGARQRHQDVVFAWDRSESFSALDELHDGQLRAYAVSRMRAMAVDAHGVHPAVTLRFSALRAPLCFADAGYVAADFKLGRYIARLLATELRGELSLA